MVSKKELLLAKAKKKLFLEKYLQELNALCRPAVIENDLVSLEETYSIIKKSKSQILDAYSEKTEFAFNEKERLAKYFEEFNERYSQGVYVFTKYSKYCRALFLKSLQDFNIDFKFEDEHAGLISMLDKNVTNKILLDYYEDNSKYLIEIEIYGERWLGIL